MQSQAQILVELSSDETGPHCGQFVSADDAIILIELTRPLPARIEALNGRFVEVHVFIDQRYLFSVSFKSSLAEDEFHRFIDLLAEPASHKPGATRRQLKRRSNGCWQILGLQRWSCRFYQHRKLRIITLVSC